MTSQLPGEPDRASALELRGVSRRFGAVVALDDVSLVVRPGTVHALLGENGAGKSTLMRIAYGMLRADAGTIRVDGAERVLTSPADAIGAGMGMVHQHFTLVPAMTVAENVALGGRGRYVPAEAAGRVAELARHTGFALDPAALVETLGVGAQQRVEIAKALSRDARLLVLDEPTGVLAPSEIDELLRWLRGYVAAGHAAVLITHKLREALGVADDVTVLRRGRVALHARAGDVTAASLTAAMLGTRLTAIDVAAGVVDGVVDDSAPVGTALPRDLAAAAFDARAVTVVQGGVVHLREATFTVARGEIVGVAAVEGSGQRELLRVLAGRLAPTAGLLHRPPQVGFVPEDRHHDAVLLERSLAESVALRGAGTRRGRMRWSALRARTHALMQAFDVRGSGAGMRTRDLSGGNQQKLVLARELDADDTHLNASAAVTSPEGRSNAGVAHSNAGAAWGAPPEEHRRSPAAHSSHHGSAHVIPALPPVTAIVLENPTRGLDVRATAAVHARLRDAAAAGTAVVVYSSDLDEVLALASRVLVVFDGAVRVVGRDRDAVGRAMLGLA